MRKKNKKGSLEDLGMIILFVFGFCFLALIGYKLANGLNTEIQASSALEAHGKTAANTIESFYPGVIDNSALFFTIGLCIVSLVLAGMVRVHPIFLVFYIMFLPFMIYMGAVFSNVYETMATNAELSTLASNLTMISIITQWLPLIVTVIGILLAIVMYKNWRET